MPAKPAGQAQAAGAPGEGASSARRNVRQTRAPGPRLRRKEGDPGPKPRAADSLNGGGFNRTQTAIRRCCCLLLCPRPGSAPEAEP